MKIEWRDATSETYCVDSGIPVLRGQQCVVHIDSRLLCYVSTRPNPRCVHSSISLKQEYPICTMCGRTGQMVKDETDVG